MYSVSTAMVSEPVRLLATQYTVTSDRALGNYRPKLPINASLQRVSFSRLMNYSGFFYMLFLLW